MSGDRGSAGRGCAQLLGIVLLLLAFLGLMFWPYVAIWLGELFGV